MGDHPTRGWAVVTGASRGIGFEIAKSLGAVGFRLALTARKTENMSRISDMMKRAGVEHRLYGCDHSKREEVVALSERLLSELGDVEVLVNNAGILRVAPVSKMEDADFEEVLAVNLLSVFWLTKRLLPRLAERRRGRVINISSLSAVLGTPQLAAYGASKWALNGLTRSLANETAGTGVSVYAVMPGSTDTDMLKATSFAPEFKAEEIANVVRYLATEAPPAMHGALVEAFGGIR